MPRAKTCPRKKTAPKRKSRRVAYPPELNEPPREKYSPRVKSFPSSELRSFRPYFQLAQRPKDGLGKLAQTMTVFTHFDSLLHDDVLHFLGPHEILALFRTCTAAWEALTPKSKRFVLLQSVFGYLRISEECAQMVIRGVRGGWRAFSPLLVRMCEDLAAIYGHLEPDLVHRCVLGEQACCSSALSDEIDYDDYDGYAGYDEDEDDTDMSSYYHFRFQSACGRSLLVRRYEDYGCHFEESHRFEQRIETLEEAFETETAAIQLRDPPFYSEIRNHRKSYGIAWGGSRDMIGSEDEEEFEDKLTWMRQNADAVQNNIHYKRRLEDGLFPVFPLYSTYQCCAHHYVLTIGPNLEQILSMTSEPDSCPPPFGSFVGSEDDSFFSRWRNSDGRGAEHGSIIDILLGVDEDELGRELRILCMAIWCMRHGFKPFDDPSIDWHGVIAAIFEERVGCEAHIPFFLDALRHPLFGRADAKYYREL